MRHHTTSTINDTLDIDWRDLEHVLEDDIWDIGRLRSLISVRVNQDLDRPEQQATGTVSVVKVTERDPRCRRVTTNVVSRLRVAWVVLDGTRDDVDASIRVFTLLVNQQILFLEHTIGLASVTHREVHNTTNVLGVRVHLFQDFRGLDEWELLLEVGIANAFPQVNHDRARVTVVDVVAEVDTHLGLAHFVLHLQTEVRHRRVLWRAERGFTLREGLVGSSHRVIGQSTQLVLEGARLQLEGRRRVGERRWGRHGGRRRRVENEVQRRHLVEKWLLGEVVLETLNELHLFHQRLAEELVLLVDTGTNLGVLFRFLLPAKLCVVFGRLRRLEHFNLFLQVLDLGAQGNEFILLTLTMLSRSLGNLSTTLGLWVFVFLRVIVRVLAGSRRWGFSLLRGSGRGLTALFLGRRSRRRWRARRGRWSSRAWRSGQARDRRIEAWEHLRIRGHQRVHAVNRRQRVGTREVSQGKRQVHAHGHALWHPKRALQALRKTSGGRQRAAASGGVARVGGFTQQVVECFHG